MYIFRFYAFNIPTAVSGSKTVHTSWTNCIYP